MSLPALALRRPVTTVAATLALVLLGGSACTQADVGAIRVLTLPGADTLIAPSSELLAGPGDVAIDKRGTVYVADYRLAQVLVVADPAGPHSARVIGRKGRGPGEFELPMVLAVGEDTVRVADVRGAHIQLFTTAGRFVRSQPLPPAIFAGAVALTGDGRVAVATGGREGAGLAATFDSGGGQVRAYGEPVVRAPGVFNMTGIKAEIRAGKVPDAIRNFGLPFFATDGGLWLVLLAEGVVQRFDSGATLLWSVPFDVPEVAAIKAHFFARNRELEGNPATFYSLQYVSDGAAVGDSAWLLLNMPEDDPSVLVVLGGDGAVRARVVLAGVRGARSFVIDQTRRRVYLAVPSAAALVAVQLPEEGG